MRIHSIESEYEVYHTNFRFKSKINEKGIPIQVLVYSLNQISSLSLAQYIVLVKYSYYLYCSHTSLYKSLYCTLLFTHTIYRLFNFSFSHFILLSWYQSQKRVTAITPNHYLSDLVYSSIKSSNHSCDVIDQTSLIKTQLETAPKELARALMRHPKFLQSQHAPTCPHVPPPYYTRQTRPRAIHTPRRHVRPK